MCLNKKLISLASPLYLVFIPGREYKKRVSDLAVVSSRARPLFAQGVIAECLSMRHIIVRGPAAVGLLSRSAYIYIYLYMLNKNT